jgi:hypothetical protein
MIQIMEEAVLLVAVQAKVMVLVAVLLVAVLVLGPMVVSFKETHVVFHINIVIMKYNPMEQFYQNIKL